MGTVTSHHRQIFYVLSTHTMQTRKALSNMRYLMRGRVPRASVLVYALRRFRSDSLKSQVDYHTAGLTSSRVHASRIELLYFRRSAREKNRGPDFLREHCFLLLEPPLLPFKHKQQGTLPTPGDRCLAAAAFPQAKQNKRATRRRRRSDDGPR